MEAENSKLRAKLDARKRASACMIYSYSSVDTVEAYIRLVSIVFRSLWIT